MWHRITSICLHFTYKIEEKTLDFTFHSHNTQDFIKFSNAKLTPAYQSQVISVALPILVIIASWKEGVRGH